MPPKSQASDSRGRGRGGRGAQGGRGGYTAPPTDAPPQGGGKSSAQHSQNPRGSSPVPQQHAGGSHSGGGRGRGANAAAHSSGHTTREGSGGGGGGNTTAPAAPVMGIPESALAAFGGPRMKKDLRASHLHAHFSLKVYVEAIHDKEWYDDVVETTCRLLGGEDAGMTKELFESFHPAVGAKITKKLVEMGKIPATQMRGPQSPQSFDTPSVLAALSASVSTATTSLPATTSGRGGTTTTSAAKKNPPKSAPGRTDEDGYAAEEDRSPAKANDEGTTGAGAHASRSKSPVPTNQAHASTVSIAKNVMVSTPALWAKCQDAAVEAREGKAVRNWTQMALHDICDITEHLLPTNGGVHISGQFSSASPSPSKKKSHHQPSATSTASPQAGKLGADSAAAPQTVAVDYALLPGKARRRSGSHATWDFVALLQAAVLYTTHSRHFLSITSKEVSDLVMVASKGANWGRDLAAAYFTEQERVELAVMHVLHSDVADSKGTNDNAATTSLHSPKKGYGRGKGGGGGGGGGSTGQNSAASSRSTSASGRSTATASTTHFARASPLGVAGGAAAFVLAQKTTREEAAKAAKFLTSLPPAAPPPSSIRREEEEFVRQAALFLLSALAANFSNDVFQFWALLFPDSNLQTLLANPNGKHPLVTPLLFDVARCQTAAVHCACTLMEANGAQLLLAAEPKVSTTRTARTAASFQTLSTRMATALRALHDAVICAWEMVSVREGFGALPQMTPTLPVASPTTPGATATAAGGRSAGSAFAVEERSGKTSNRSGRDLDKATQAPKGSESIPELVGDEEGDGHQAGSLLSAVAGKNPVWRTIILNALSTIIIYTPYRACPAVRKLLVERFLPSRAFLMTFKTALQTKREADWTAAQFCLTAAARNRQFVKPFLHFCLDTTAGKRLLNAVFAPTPTLDGVKTICAFAREHPLVISSHWDQISTVLKAAVDALPSSKTKTSDAIAFSTAAHLASDRGSSSSASDRQKQKQWTATATASASTAQPSRGLFDVDGDSASTTASMIALEAIRAVLFFFGNTGPGSDQEDDIDAIVRQEEWIRSKGKEHSLLTQKLAPVSINATATITAAHFVQTVYGCVTTCGLTLDQGAPGLASLLPAKNTVASGTKPQDKGKGRRASSTPTPPPEFSGKGHAAPTAGFVPDWSALEAALPQVAVAANAAGAQAATPPPGTLLHGFTAYKNTPAGCHRSIPAKTVFHIALAASAAAPGSMCGGGGASSGTITAMPLSQADAPGGKGGPKLAPTDRTVATDEGRADAATKIDAFEKIILNARNSSHLRLRTFAIKPYAHLGDDFFQALAKRDADAAAASQQPTRSGPKSGKRRDVDSTQSPSTTSMVSLSDAVFDSIAFDITREPSSEPIVAALTALRAWTRHYPASMIPRRMEAFTTIAQTYAHDSHAPMVRLRAVTLAAAVAETLRDLHTRNVVDGNSVARMAFTTITLAAGVYDFPLGVPSPGAARAVRTLGFGLLALPADRLYDECLGNEEGVVNEVFGRLSRCIERASYQCVLVAAVQIAAKCVASVDLAETDPQATNELVGAIARCAAHGLPLGRLASLKALSQLPKALLLSISPAMLMGTLCSTLRWAREDDTSSSSTTATSSMTNDRSALFGRASAAAGHSASRGPSHANQHNVMSASVALTKQQQDAIVDLCGLLLRKLVRLLTVDDGTASAPVAVSASTQPPQTKTSASTAGTATTAPSVNVAGSTGDLLWDTLSPDSQPPLPERQMSFAGNNDELAAVSQATARATAAAAASATSATNAGVAMSEGSSKTGAAGSVSAAGASAVAAAGRRRLQQSYASDQRFVEELGSLRRRYQDLWAELGLFGATSSEEEEDVPLPEFASSGLDTTPSKGSSDPSA